MKFSLKALLCAIVKMAAAAIFCGGLFLFVILYASLTGWPPYLQYALQCAAGILLIAAVLAAGGFLSARAGRWLRNGVLAALALCLFYCGWGAYQASIPTLDDRSLLLEQYEPFGKDSLAVRLEEPSTLQLESPLPCLDGATALYPVYAAFVQAVYPEAEYALYTPSASGYGRVACTGTVDAYQRLIEGRTDLIFAAGPSQAQLDDAAAAGRELHLTPIGREAFVFFVNSRNPVTGLTVEQIRGIYSGQITNWKEVGGKNESIRPFQRMENSGSQTALRRLMADTPLMEPEQEDRVADMGGIIRQVARYRNYRNALGFSFRFYAAEMAADDSIRLLALNGVEPAPETIRDGSYPLTSEFYAVTAGAVGKPAPQEYQRNLSAFLDWILSPQGQELIEKTGYTAIEQP